MVLPLREEPTPSNPNTPSATEAQTCYPPQPSASPDAPFAPGDPEATHYTKTPSPPADPEKTNYSSAAIVAAIVAGRKPRFQPGPFGPYDLLEEIARGGMGVVYKAQHRATGRIVALKRILADRLASNESVERFQLEARAAAALDHPGIVPIYEIGAVDGQHYFTMAFIAGGSLQQALAQGPLPAPVAAWVARQVAEAVQFAHDKGIIHRDIKPHNILLQGDDHAGGSSLGSALRQGKASKTARLPTPRLGDFGLARLGDTSGLSITGEAMGTPSYMPPEQAAGQRARVGVGSDVYSVGAVLYCLLTGRPPFQASSPYETLRLVSTEDPVPPRQFNPVVPADLENICLKCLQKEPERRYRTAGELAADLGRFVAGKPVRARPVGILGRGWRWYRRNRAVAGLLTALAVVLLLGAGLATMLAVLASHNALQARQEARRADLEAGHAKQERDQARLESERAARAESKAEWRLYASQIRLAQQEWQQGQASVAWHHLDSCRRDFRGWEHDYLSALFNQNQRTFHTGTVNCVLFSPDGKCLVSAGWDKVIKVWDVDKGQVVLTLPGHTGPVQCLAFSPDGTRLASACGGLITTDGALKVCDAKTGQEAVTLQGYTGSVRCLAFSPDGKRLITVSLEPLSMANSGKVKVWDARTGQEVLSLKGNMDLVRCVTFSPDGKRLLSAGDDGIVNVWDADTGRKDLTFKGHQSSATCMAFSHDGKRLASANNDWTITVWDLDKGQEALTFQGHLGSVRCLAFSPDSQRLASACEDQTIKVWEADTGREVLTFKGHTGEVTSVAFSPDGRQIASGSMDRTVKVWKADKRQGTLTLNGHRDMVSSLAFSPDGKRLASAGFDQTIKVWDTARGQEVLALKGHTAWITSVSFGPDSRRLASASLDGTIKVWDARTGQEALSFTGHAPGVSCLAFSPDGKRLASSSGDEKGFEKWTGYLDPKPRDVKLWDAETGQEVLSLKGHMGRITSVAFSPDGKRLASASDDHTVKVWDLDKGQEAFTLKGQIRVVFSADGKRLASAGPDQTITVWDAQTGQEVLSLQGHTARVTSVAFSPDGKRLASASGDSLKTGEVMVWDARTGQETLTLKEHLFGICCVVFSPDGKRLASSSMNGTIKVWDASLSAPAPRPAER